MKKLSISFLLVALTIVSSQLAFAQNNFSDLQNGHDYLNAIEEFTQKGILVGYPDGTFKPDQTVTRAEFLKITLEYTMSVYGKSQGVFDGKIGCFNDVAEHWAEKYICFAFEQGIVHGDDDTGLFNPNRNVNFAEASRIITNLNGGASIDSDPWYATSVDIVESMKAIPPSVTAVDQFITRAETSEMIYRTHNELDSLEEYNYFPGTDYDFTRTLKYLDEYHSLMDNTIVDQNLMVVASDVGDIRKFEDEDCLENCPWRTDDYLLFNSQLYLDVNMDDLDFLNEYIAVDDKNLYYFLPTGDSGYVEGVDTDSVEIPENFELYYEDIDTYYEPSPYLTVYQVMDKDNIYLILNSDLFDGKGNLWREALTMEEPALDFSRNEGEEDAVLIVPNPDDEEVEFVGKHHFKLGDKAYFLNKEIEGVDAETFEVYTGGTFYFVQRYSHDKDNVYYRGELREDADPDTFEALEGSWYYKDENHVFDNEGFVLEGVDVNDFEFLHSGAGILGDDVVYFYGNLVEGADPDTFEVYTSFCLKDADKYFYEDLDRSDGIHYYEVTEEEFNELCPDEPYNYGS